MIMYTRSCFFVSLLAFALCLSSGVWAEPGTNAQKNSLGMTLVKIPAGDFEMGSTDRKADHDEQPVHRVRIGHSFRMAATEVTNAQYELFDPSHRGLRGKRGFSAGDNEAAIFVTWRDALSFCIWLSEKEGRSYRLPTEAEWEYACRAGTTTAYSTGDILPKACRKEDKFSWDPEPTSLEVGRTAPNPWGLHDMHGNVEEWCLDWHGPYPGETQNDPVGYTNGLFKVCRGGSHNTNVLFLRSANRMGTLPEDKHWLLGFRVVQAPTPEGRALPQPAAKPWAQNVGQSRFEWPETVPEREAFFATPIPFVLPPADANTDPFYPHNHCPSIVWCDNGDLLAAWFSTRSEKGREMTILASRLRAGATAWPPSSEFFKAPDRNMTGTSLFNDGKGTLYHFNGLEAGEGWANLALVLRTSNDNGASWSTPRLINAEHQRRNQVIDGTSMTAGGALIQPCDAVYSGNGGTAIHISRDAGATWIEPGAGTPMPDFEAGKQGATIGGIHAGVVELRDGRLLAFGRGDSIRSQVGDGHNIDDRMPMSLSEDMGKTWIYSASPFPPISSGQRLVLMRLREGPLFFASFTGPHDSDRTMTFRDPQGNDFEGQGLFGALSFDEGETWPIRRLLTPSEGHFETYGHTKTFEADESHAEPRGYLAATQPPEGTIHLISSGLHYRFNLAWLKSGA